LMPSPDLFVVVDAPLAVLARRRALRGRATDDLLISSAELAGFQALLDSWLAGVCPARVIHVTPGDWHQDPAQVHALAARLTQRL
jgi:deoxyadenosine/deoxycytidine kinase